MNDFSWADPLKTNDTQVIVCGIHNSNRILEKMEYSELDKYAKSINRFFRINRTFKGEIVVPQSYNPKNYNIAAIVKKWHRKNKISWKYVTIKDYHRSTKSRGIKFENKKIRVRFYFGLPFIPRNSLTSSRFRFDEISFSILFRAVS
jgi:hypothetical protein